jgi:hypothetical protein
MPREIDERTPLESQIEVRADIGGIQIGFVASAAAEDIDARLDEWENAISRQRARQELVGALNDLWTRRMRLAMLPQEEVALRRSRIAERTGLVARWQIEADAKGTRSIGQARQERQRLAEFDLETQAQVEKLEQERDLILQQMSLSEQLVARQRALVAGKTRIEVTEDDLAAIERGAQVEAAD